MLLCLDVGNTHIMGGVFDGDNLVLRFRCNTHLIGTSDQFGMFLISLMQNNNIPPKSIKATAVCSVVPSYDYTIKHTIAQYFGTPYFVLQTGVKTGLNIKYKNPKEVGADRIANAIAAVNLFPNKNIIIVDMGTATTLCIITKNRDYLGGSIFPGLRVAMESLKSNTAKLIEVDIEVPASYYGRTTRECIQSGLYYGQLGALKEIISGIKKEVFADEASVVLGTGGFSQLYKDQSLFDVILPDLVLQGLHKAHEYFCQEKIKM
jgi:type III pantothenate kinase